MAINNSIFANVTSEISINGATNLGSSFGEIGSGTPPSTADNVATFKGKFAAFLIYFYGGPESITYTDGVMYAGPQDMHSAHLGLDITGDQYNYFLTNIIVPALISNGVNNSDITSCFAPPLLNAAFEASIAQAGAGTAGAGGTGGAAGTSGAAGAGASFGELSTQGQEPACDDCLMGADPGGCCNEDAACSNDTACVACVTAATPAASCASKANVVAFNNCVDKACATACE